MGSVPTGILVGRLEGVDPRTQGSGRVGATNTFRAVGWRGAVLVATGDITKGLVFTLLALRLTAGTPLEVGSVGLATVLGQVWSVWLRGRGGRGVATSAGVALALWPLGVLLAAATLVGVAWRTRLISAASLSSAAALVLWVGVTVRDPGWLAVAAALGITVWLSHWDSLGRLMTGTERRI